MSLDLAPLRGLAAAALLSLPSLAQSGDRIPIPSLPFTIDRSGSYYLTQTLFADGGGLVIFADDVTVDLNGFGLVGRSTPTNAVVAPVSVRNLVVCNGSITGWGLSALQLGNAQHARLADLELTDNGAFGLANGVEASIEDCLIARNGQGGMDLFDGCVVRRCTVVDNHGIGLDALRRTTVEQCVVNGNSSSGVVVLENSLVQGCRVVSNGSVGIQVERQCRVIDNACSSQLTGIRVTNTRCEVTDNLVTSCTLGIKVDTTRSLIGRNSLGSNTTNFDVASGNLLGPLVTSLNFASNTNPNANYQL